jgi:hypothetical protein
MEVSSVQSRNTMKLCIHQYSIKLCVIAGTLHHATHADDLPTYTETTARHTRSKHESRHCVAGYAALDMVMLDQEDRVGGTHHVCYYRLFLITTQG